MIELSSIGALLFDCFAERFLLIIIEVQDNPIVPPLISFILKKRADGFNTPDS